jgi:hypothetical protein
LQAFHADPVSVTRRAPSPLPAPGAAASGLAAWTALPDTALAQGLVARPDPGSLVAPGARTLLG